MHPELEHREGFVLAKIHRIEPSEEAGRRRITFDSYSHIRRPGLWPGLRNPVKYTSLADLDIDPTALDFVNVNLASPRRTLVASPHIDVNDVLAQAAPIDDELAKRLNCCSSLASVIGVNPLRWNAKGRSSAAHVLDSQSEPLRITRLASGIEKLCSYCGDGGVFVLANKDGRVEVACDVHVRPVVHYLSAGSFVIRNEPFQEWIRNPIDLSR